MKVVMKCFKFRMLSRDIMETHMENNILLLTPRRRYVSNPREKENPQTIWSKHISSEGGLL